ncbi:hypothetical protein [Zhengella mangrovi]|uniref:hypothetical protein n=1 Tax=Zhengella mangrovi TaxID=1982044 RepID=UPI001054E420|nr:hypothetical protein [Zhengella mangrovi]
MNVSDVEEQVASIARLTDDHAAAHMAEEFLYEQVLRAIANGICKDPRGCAQAALAVAELDFPRLYG